MALLLLTPTRIVVALMAGLSVVQSCLPAIANEALHKACLAARDYEGCIKAWSSSQPNDSLKAFSENDERGVKLKSFNALRAGADCKIVFYENALDICGTIVGRRSIEKWEQVNLQGCNAVGTWCIGQIHFDLSYLTEAGIYGDRITFLNRNAARSLSELFTKWSGRIQG